MNNKNILNKLTKKIVSVDELIKVLICDNYLDFIDNINKLVDDNKLLPIKSSGSNGKNPPLFKKYRILKQEKNISNLINELNYTLSTKFKITYYKNNIEKYENDRIYILMLNDFIINRHEMLLSQVSMNERSFQIWGREKFLQKEGGKSIVKNLGLSLDFLNFYDTSEPLAYYSKNKNTPQNILILENKDTYYTFRKHLININEINNNLFNTDINTLIYGGGKKIIKAFKDFKISVEDYILDKRNTILYFGDLDYEGIIIYEKLYELFHEQYNIKLFVNAYKKMIDKAKVENITLPNIKEKQNSNIKEIFLDEFDDKYREEICKILKKGCYIPQEIININDLV